MAHNVFVGAAAAGFAMGASLIIAIGAQNAFVLRQGLRRDHVASVVLTCIACDVALIALGAVGFGALVARLPALMAIAAWGGAAFLLFYGARALVAAIHPGALATGSGDDRDGGGREGFATAAAAVGATLAISLLNPHVYLDTVVLLGSVAAQYPSAVRVWFVAGAMGASAIWFAVLGFGARLLAPAFRSPIAWRVLDLVIAVIMVSIAISLIVGQLG